jgi:hypothetical protein
MLIELIAPQSLAYLVTASGGCGLDRRSLRFSRVRSSASRTKSDCTRPKAVVVVRLPSFAAATLALADLLIFLLHAPNIELQISQARAGGPRHVDGVILDVIVSATSEYRGSCMPSRLWSYYRGCGKRVAAHQLLILSQLSSRDTIRQIRSLAPREHLLFLDFYHHVGNRQRHDPTRPDAGSVLPPRNPNSVRLEPIMPSRRGPDDTDTQRHFGPRSRMRPSTRRTGSAGKVRRRSAVLEPGARQAAAEAWSPTFVYGILFKASAETVLSRPTRSTLEPALA